MGSNPIAITNINEEENMSKVKIKYIDTFGQIKELELTSYISLTTKRERKAINHLVQCKEVNLVSATLTLLFRKAFNDDEELRYLSLSEEQLTVFKIVREWIDLSIKNKGIFVGKVVNPLKDY